MTQIKGEVSYKKKNGTVILSHDASSLAWTPSSTSGATPSVTFKVAWITNLQATPPSNEKAMLKVSVQQPGTDASQTHIFTFTSSSRARAEADTVKDALSLAIQRSKTNASRPADNATEAGGAGQSAAMAIASAVSSNPNSDGWLDDSRLSSDSKLQQSLLKSDSQLQKTFMEALKTKPSSVSNSHFTAQFWSSRTHLLRAHAIEKNQSRGAYNVLSTMKPVSVDNETTMKINPEQIQLIFKQHPLVKRVYDENVPKLNEAEFWSQFFTSRLLKKLKGEKIIDADPVHPLLDRYLQYDTTSESSRRTDDAQIPNFIDLEGNEVNHSQRKGNQPDWTMRPSAVEKVPIIRTLNNLSEKIMSQVAPSDIDAAEPIGMDEETFKELALRDLQRESEDSGIVLSLKDQQKFFQADKEGRRKKESVKVDPRKAVKTLRASLKEIATRETASGLDLNDLIGIQDDDDSDDEDDAEASAIGSRKSLNKAREQISRSVNLCRSHMNDDISADSGDVAALSAASGLSVALYDRMQLTHATTTEFLRHFWLVFLSGDPSRADELAGMVESLNRAMDRIEAVAKDADAERQRSIDQKKREIREAFQRDGRKRKLDLESIPGGASVTRQILGPTVTAVGAAIANYKKALAMEGVD